MPLNLTADAETGPMSMSKFDQSVLQKQFAGLAALGLGIENAFDPAKVTEQFISSNTKAAQFTLSCKRLLRKRSARELLPGLLVQRAITGLKVEQELCIQTM